MYGMKFSVFLCQNNRTSTDWLFWKQFFCNLSRKSVQTLSFTFFSRKFHVFIDPLPHKKSLILHMQNKYTYKFYTFTIKIDSWNMSESDKFRFENNLQEILKLENLFKELTVYFRIIYTKEIKSFNLYWRICAWLLENAMQTVAIASPSSLIFTWPSLFIIGVQWIVSQVILHRYANP